MAMFRGGGLALAERLVTKDPDTFEMQTSTVAGTEDSPADGSPFRPSMASRGVCWLRGGAATPLPAIEGCSPGCRKSSGGKLENANPVHVPAMTYRSFGECFHDENDFIDGGDGGYAMAAKGLQAQMKYPD